MSATEVTVQNNTAVEQALQTINARPKKRRNWLKAFKHIDLLRRDNDDTEQVFKIIEALQGNANEEQFRRFLATDIGQKVINEKRSALDFLTKRDWLQSLPEGTLGKIYIDFMIREGLTAEGLRDVSYEGGFAVDKEQTEEERVFSEWNRDIHDLFHIITGYGRDPLGELSVLAVTYQQTKSLGVGFIAFMGSFEYQRVLKGTPVVKAILQGFKIGKECEDLVAQDWEHLLTLPIEDVRAQLGLRTPTHYNKVIETAKQKRFESPRYIDIYEEAHAA